MGSPRPNNRPSKPGRDTDRGTCPICGETMNGGKLPQHMVAHL